jgi:SAM-dependent methyltransferase
MRAGPLLDFRCNICGNSSRVPREGFGREVSSCRHCGSTVRFRSIIHVLSKELFGRSLALPEFPRNPGVRGIGMTDWEGYAVPLVRKLGYRNTFYHQEPRLDITRIDFAQEGSADFVISSDVFEHVPPPVSVAFVNMRRLLKPGGLAVLTVPYGLAPRTVEHFPELHDYRIDRVGDRYVMTNTTRGGRVEVFEDLVFHGGPGTTLEMRQFSEASLLADLAAAGWVDVKIHREPCEEFGVYWDEPWSLPLSARAPRGGVNR